MGQILNIPDTLSAEDFQMEVLDGALRFVRDMYGIMRHRRGQQELKQVSVEPADTAGFVNDIRGFIRHAFVHERAGDGDALYHLFARYCLATDPRDWNPCAGPLEGIWTIMRCCGRYADKTDDGKQRWGQILSYIDAS